MNLTFGHIFAFFHLICREKLCLEQKRPQPTGRKIVLVSDNKISEVWAFLLQNLAKQDERCIDWPKFMADQLILFTNGHSGSPLFHPHSKLCCFSRVLHVY